MSVESNQHTNFPEKSLSQSSAKRVEENRNYSGARWWSVDFHAHSPASFDFESEEGKHNQSKAKSSYEDWLRAYMEAGIDGVVITDHNTFEGIDEARTALKKIYQENSDFPPLTIFPGVELTISNGTHILAIFDPSEEAQTISNLIAQCGYDGRYGGSTTTANITLKDIAPKVRGLGGICIPAHVDTNAGMFARSQLDLNGLDETTFDAVEVIDDRCVNKAEEYGWAAVLGSDAHFLTTAGCPEDKEAKAPGTHFTYVKAENLDLKGIRLALVDYKESIIRARKGADNPNLIPHDYIDYVEVTRNEKTETFNFNPWMNCLIGGRGVGKSTVLEIIRLALGRSTDLKDTPLEDELARFLPGTNKQQRWWDDNTSILVQYRKDSLLLRATWSGAKPEVSILEAYIGGQWVSQEGVPEDRTPIQIFSQKQIYELARQPQSFLSMLDRLPEIRKGEWAEEYQQLEGNAKRARQSLRELRQHSGRASRLKGELEEVQSRLKHLNELRSTAEFNELETIQKNLEKADYVTTQSQYKIPELEQQAADLADMAKTTLAIPECQELSARLKSAADLITSGIENIKIGIDEWEKTEQRAKWTARSSVLTTWLTEQSGASGGSTRLNTHDDLEREKQLINQLAEFSSIETKLEEKEREVGDAISALGEKRKELYDRRKSAIDILTRSAAGSTKISVHHQAELNGLSEKLRELFRCPTGYPSLFEETGLPQQILSKQPKSPLFATKDIPQFKREIISLLEDGSSSNVVKAGLRVDARFFRRNVTEDQIFDAITDILLWYPEDLVTVQYRPHESGNYESLDRGSPGQKTAALLAVILQMGSEPLFLDQPEDDLENKLIRQLAVETLKNIKTNRQLVVSTHNANMVVTSGAENILVIEHQSEVPRVEAKGTLQNPIVKDNVCLILEGGEEAIKTRYRRLVDQ